MVARFCLRCAARLLSTASRTQSCPRCGWQFFNNPAPTASVLIVRGREVLLARRAIAPYKGYWDPISGFVKPGETPEQAVRREAREELGLRVVLDRLLGIFADVYGSRDMPTLNVYYVGHLANPRGQLRPAADVAEVAWFSIDRLPPQIAFQNNRDALRLLRRKRRTR